MEEFLKKILGWWKNLEKKKKITYIIYALSVIIVMIILFVVISLPHYTLLVSGLNETQAGQVIAKLDEQGVKYKAGPNGSIYVSNSQKYELRMKLASEGVLGNNSRGYELLQNQGFGATSFDKQVNYQIALEGELERSISAITGVSFARVHLVIPPKTYYTVGDNAIPKASVMISLATGAQITQEQVKGIVELISGAVQGLEPKNVRVVDNYSRDLSSSIYNDDMGSANTKFQMKQMIESYYTKKIQQTMQTVFGFGNVVVMSDVELNWQKLEQEERTVEPVNKSSGIILSQQQESEQTINSSTNSGAPGTTSNIPPYDYQTQTSDQNAGYSKSKVITNYDINEIYKKTIDDRTGEIAKKSFTIYIDFLKSGVTETEEIIKNIKSSITTATGSVQDNISVLSLTFNREMDNEKSKIEAENLRRRKLITYVILIMVAIVMLLFLLYVALLYMRRKKTYTLIEERKKKLEERVKEVVGEIKEEPMELSPSQEMQKRLETIVDSRPNDVVEIIKIWINTQ